MTEEEWLACAELDGMLLAWKQPSERKGRLFGCACMRRVWRVLAEDHHRRAIEIAERFADAHASAEEMKAARELADSTYQGVGDIIADHGALIARELCSPGAVSLFGMDQVCAIAAEACEEGETTWSAAYSREQAIQCHLLRDIVGNPFRPLPPRKRKRIWQAQLRIWLDWKDGTVVALAQAAYELRQLPEGDLDGARLAVLADALEEAGCTEVALLDHCREAGPHVRGCWVVDLLRDRS